jgi:uncharacterized protein YjbI with pentapeptide repeats
MTPDLAALIWARLSTGKSLADLQLPEVKGRVDLRDLSVPPRAVVREKMHRSKRVAEISGFITVRGALWKGLDFSGAQLESLRFHETSIADCRFDGARCVDWRMWRTRIADTSFCSADLRGSALGGIKSGTRNAFRGVDFTNADLRQTVHQSADMVACTFCKTNLSGVDFQGTVFVDCTFEGELSKVLFYRHAFRGEAFPPNEMKGVDLRQAKLLYVQFRGLDMDQVYWPEDGEHFLVEDYPATLDRMLAAFGARSDLGSKRVAAVLGMHRKWAGPNQRLGVVSKAELLALGGAEAVVEFLRVLGH